jgi:hypothetical protein
MTQSRSRVLLRNEESFNIFGSQFPGAHDKKLGVGFFYPRDTEPI